MEVSSSRCVVGNESAEEDRGAKEYLGFFEVFRKRDVHDSIFALLGQLVTVVLDFVTEECGLCDT